jgi:hypothetical protein
MKQMAKKLSFAGLLLLVGCFASCNDGEDLKDLTVDVSSSLAGEYVIEQGQSLEIPFTVGEAKNAELTVAATADDTDYKVEATLSALDPQSGVITVTAPDLILSPTTVTITLEVDDVQTQRVTISTVEVSAKLVDEFVEITSPANCYVVAPGALVKFPANIGNTTEQVSFSTAELLWQDTKGLVEQLIAAPEKNSVYAVLQAGVSGNAVVAVKNADGTVVWSYHLWVADFNPDENVMTWTDADSGVTYKMMDRYVGAVSNLPGSDLAHGLFYQWGRKDPFGASSYEGKFKPMYNIDGEEVSRTIEACAAEDNIPNAIANPLTHYSGVSGGNYSWLTTVKATIATDAIADLWGAVSGTQTKYDPCPAGWRVAPQSAWTFYNDTEVTKEVVYAEGVESPANKDQLGRYISTNGTTKFFFPSQGEVAHGGGFSNGVGTTWPCGKAWTSTVDATYYRSCGTTVSPTSVSYKGGYTQGYELPVRCVKL